MAYALVTDGTIDAIQGNVPTAARRLDTGEWVMGLRHADPDTQRATGWYKVQNTDRPADTPTTTHERSVEMVDHGEGPVPTVVWTERDKTQAEQDGEAEEADRETDRQQLTADLTKVREVRDKAKQRVDDKDPTLEADGGTGLPRWQPLPVDGTATNEDMAKLLNRMIVDQRAQDRDIRALSSAVGRIIRAQRLDDAGNIGPTPTSL